MNTEAKVRESIRRAHQQNGGKFIDAVCDAAFDAVDQGKALGWPESTLRGIIAGYIRIGAEMMPAAEKAQLLAGAK